ncbi:ATP-binding protein [Mesorhizobium sp. VK23D]|nr:ATP-binding protein [Mesorhizobium sp. VK23D]MDX8522804.1 ATP-binding protein [Mesorhizobium sp. VK23D]
MIKTLAGFDFSFQLSLDRDRIVTLAQFGFVARCEVVHFLGPPGTGKSHLAIALAIEAVKTGKNEPMSEHLRSKASIAPPTLNPPSRPHGRRRKMGTTPRRPEGRN